MNRTNPCYIFDIDGTLADCSHRLHHIVREEGDHRPKDWDGFHKHTSGDTPIPAIVSVCKAIIDAGNFVIFVTGRSEDCRADTEKWLAEHVSEGHRLYMRASGDRRDDVIVKRELLGEVIADGFAPVMAFEDRARVVAMWRSEGVPCAQVSEGDF